MISFILVIILGVISVPVMAQGYDITNGQVQPAENPPQNQQPPAGTITTESGTQPVPVYNTYKTEVTQVIRQEITQEDVNKLLRLSIDQKPIPVALQNAAESLVNRDLAFFDRYGKIHIKATVSEADIRSADAQQAYALRLVVRAMREIQSKDHKRIDGLEKNDKVQDSKLQNLESKTASHDKALGGHMWWLIAVTIIAIAALILALWRLRTRRVGGHSGH
jgi:hypothetical protein